jgi:hypothetical protein
MRLAAAIVVTAWMASGVAFAGEPPLLSAVEKCPAKSGCIVVDINVSAKIEDPTRVIGPSKSACGGKIFRVRGRLRGSAVRTYHLALQGECMAACSDGHAPYFGRSPRNAPIILTNRGRFELVDSGVDVGIADDLIVLDETRRAIAKYIGNQAGSRDYFVERTRVYMRHGDGPCVTAPQARPGRLAIVDARYCRSQTAAQEQRVEFKNLAPASQAFVQKLAEVYKMAETLDRTTYETRAGLILVQFNAACS